MASPQGKTKTAPAMHEDQRPLDWRGQGGEGKAGGEAGEQGTPADARAALQKEPAAENDNHSSVQNKGSLGEARTQKEKEGCSSTAAPGAVQREIPLAVVKKWTFQEQRLG